MSPAHGPSSGRWWRNQHGGDSVQAKGVNVVNRHGFTSRRWLAAAAFAALLGGKAFAEDHPLTLTMSDDISHDSNYLRQPKPGPDTINTASAGLSLDKDYGRQHYSLSGSYFDERFSNDTYLNTQGYNASAGFTSDIASHWSTALAATSSESLVLPQYETITTHTDRNVRTYNDANMVLQYGAALRWGLTATLDYNRVNYSVGNSIANSNLGYANADQLGEGLRVYYNPSDLLSFGVGPRVTTTRYPVNSGLPNTVDDNLDFVANWIATGVSSLNSQVTLRSSDISSSTNRHSRAVTGTLSWSYTPAGLFNYNLSASRSTSTDRYQQSSLYLNNNGSLGIGLQSIGNNGVVSVIGASIGYLVTGKTTVSLNASDTFFQYNNEFGVVQGDTSGTAASQNGNSQLQSLGLGVNYTAQRWLSLRCNWQVYRQSADLNHLPYHGQQVDCNTTLTFN